VIHPRPLLLHLRRMSILFLLSAQHHIPCPPMCAQLSRQSQAPLRRA
jgi:hypothetical protein